MKERLLNGRAARSIVLAAAVLLFAGIWLAMPKEARAATDISGGEILLSQKSFVYDGQAKYPDVTVKVNGETISSWYYDVSYQKNTKAGTAKVIVTADDYYDYTGQLTRTFTIKKRTLYKSKFSLSKNEFVYNGKVKKISGRYYYPDGRSKFMKKGRDIKVWCAKKIKKAGYYKITVRGMGNFKGKLKYTIKVRPKKPLGVKLVRRYRSSFKIKWKKVKGASGYKVEYLNKNGDRRTRDLKKKRTFVVPIRQDYTGDVWVYSYKKSNGKKLKSNANYYYNGVKPRTAPRYSLISSYGSFSFRFKRDGWYEVWAATNKSFSEDFYAFTTFRSKGSDFTLYCSGEHYRWVKVRHYVPLRGGGRLYGKWGKRRKAIWY